MPPPSSINPSSTGPSSAGPSHADLRHAIGRALGRIVSGVYLMSAGHPGSNPAPVVMLASWVQQAAFDPPSVSVALAKGRPIAALLAEHKTFVLSVLGQNDTSLMKKYARGVPPGVDPFDGVATHITPSGATYFPDALSYLECRLLQRLDFGGDHEILIGEVVSGAILRDGPSFTHLRGNGFRY